MPTSKKSFCIVCIANYCRSPVAEVLLKTRFGDKYEFFSAGISPIAQPNMDPRSLKYLHENNCPIHTDTCFYAADKGHLNCLKFVHENGCELDEEVFDISIAREHFEICDYLIEKNCPIDQISLCQVIVDNNMKDSLDYTLKNNLIEDTHDLMIDTIIVDSLECLKVLHNHGLKLTYEFIEKSVEYGSLGCMKYLHKYGCELNKSLCEKAIYYEIGRAHV